MNPPSATPHEPMHPSCEAFGCRSEKALYLKECTRQTGCQMMTRRPSAQSETASTCGDVGPRHADSFMCKKEPDKTSPAARWAAKQSVRPATRFASKAEQRRYESFQSAARFALDPKLERLAQRAAESRLNPSEHPDAAAQLGSALLKLASSAPSSARRTVADAVENEMRKAGITDSLLISQVRGAAQQALGRGESATPRTDGRIVRARQIIHDWRTEDSAGHYNMLRDLEEVLIAGRED